MVNAPYFEIFFKFYYYLMVNALYFEIASFINFSLISAHPYSEDLEKTQKKIT